MVIECIAIFAIMAAIAVICALRKDMKHAYLILPLLLLPGANIISYFFAEGLSLLVPLDYVPTYIAIDLVAIVISGLLMGFSSKKIETKSSRVAYVVIGIIYNILLACIIIQEWYASVVQTIM